MRGKLKSLALLLLLLLLAAQLYLSLTLGLGDQGSGPMVWLNAWLLGGGDGGQEEGALSQPAAKPLELAVWGEDGLYLAQDQAGFEELLTQITPVYYEALGSAGQAAEITEQEAKALLREPAVLINYDFAVPFSLLRAWAGFDTGSIELEGDGLFLTLDGDQVVLLVRDSQAGAYTRVSTAAGADRLRQTVGGHSANATLAGRVPAYAALAWDEPVLLDPCTLPVYRAYPSVLAESSAEPAGDDGREIQVAPRELQEAFTLNPYLTGVYRDADAMVYVEGLKVLRINGRGDLSFSVASGQGIEVGGPSAGRVELVESVRRLAYELWAKAAAGGELSLQGIWQDQAGRWVFSFQTHLGGVALSQQESVRVTVENGSVTAIRMRPRRYEEEGALQVLPYRLAVAALGEAQNVRLSLRYVERENGLWEPALCYEKEED